MKKPFDTDARQNYLSNISPDATKKKSKTKSPPYGLSFASFTDNVTIKKKNKTHNIDAGHANAYLIIPGIVNYL